MADSFFVLPMQMYLADCIFPDIEGQLAAYKSFCELWDSGEMAKLDNFDGFQMLFCYLIVYMFSGLVIWSIYMLTRLKQKDSIKQNKDLANEKAKTFCYHYEPKWYDHGHFARCQVQAK